MAITFQKKPDGSAQINVAGRFDFKSHREFGEMVKAVKGSKKCVIDFGTTTYVDSSALGMMLLLRDEVENIQVRNCSPDVRKVLEIANFHRLFEIN